MDVSLILPLFKFLQRLLNQSATARSMCSVFCSILAHLMFEVTVLLALLTMCFTFAKGEEESK